MSEQNDVYRDLADPGWREREAAIDAELKALIPPRHDLVATLTAAELARVKAERDALRVAFEVNMLRAFPEKSHDEIRAAIDAAIGVEREK